MPKPVKDESSHIDEINITGNSQHMNGEINSLAPQYSNSNIFNINYSNKEAWFIFNLFFIYFFNYFYSIIIYLLFIKKII